MAQRKTSKTVKKTNTSSTKVKVEKPQSSNVPAFLQRIQSDLKSQQSPSSLLLGALIIVVLAVLAFNFFNKNINSQTPQTDSQKTEAANKDVARNALPGKYTVKSGDTLFSIAQKYYDNGYLYQQIADENKIADVNTLTTGQVLTIPKVNQPEVSPTPSDTPSLSPTPSSSPEMNPQDQSTQNTYYTKGGIGGAQNQTEWGEKITGNTYTVQEGDWLSKIAGRAYGDIFSYQKIAQANNIQNPDLIEPGMVLTIPR